MPSALALSLLILFVCFSIIGIATAIESHPNRARKFRNDVNSEMVRKALKRRNK